MPPTYRFEVAKQGRAGCQSAPCKKDGIKIDKGELRLGSLVEMPDYTTWKWKHWGCVTPLQIGNMLEQLGGLEGLDIDKDLDILDGYDEMDGWAQDKIKYALQHGHVEDSEWKGDPELNRPGKKGILKRTPKKKADEEDQNDGEDSKEKKPKKRPGRKKAAQESEEDEDIDSPKPKKAVNRKRKGPSLQDEQDDSPSDQKNSQSRGKRAKKAKTEKANDDIPDDQPLPKPKRGGRSRKIKTEDDDDVIEPANPTLEIVEEAESKTASNPRESKKSEAKQPRLSRGSKKVKTEESDIEEPQPNRPSPSTDTQALKPTPRRSAPRGRPSKSKVKNEEQDTNHVDFDASLKKAEETDIVDTKANQIKTTNAENSSKAKPKGRRRV